MSAYAERDTAPDKPFAPFTEQFEEATQALSRSARRIERALVGLLGPNVRSEGKGRETTGALEAHIWTLECLADEFNDYANALDRIIHVAEDPTPINSVRHGKTG